ncbi:MAG: hypothetical protein HY454_01055, partial [Parcubacteria group bacterium]|nr:hypothetical protein [Parcubacteria group bacterium]
SRDYGETWKLVQEFPGVINAVIINPQNTMHIFVSTFSNGIFTSADGGVSWTDETEGLSDFPRAGSVETVLLDASTTPSTLYMGSAFGLVKSNDWGVNWKAVSAVFPDEVLPVLSIAVSPRSSREIYVGANRHIYRTLNGGETWQVRQLATNKKVRVLWADPRDSNRILAGLGKPGRR